MSEQSRHLRPTHMLRKTFKIAWAALPRSARDGIASHVVAACGDSLRFRLGLPTMAGLLANMRENGFCPKTVIDIGANTGSWSLMSASVFPSARHFLFEADRTHSESLQAVCGRLRNAEFLIVLLGPEARGAVPFNLMGAGSSVLPELTSFDRRVEALSMKSLDSCVPSNLEAPILLKLDVQGFELEILRGAPRVLAGTAAVMLETALIPYNAGAPLFSEVIAYMEAAGFVPFDFCGQARRQEDRALFQADVVFVPKDSPLRSRRKFWMDELSDCPTLASPQSVHSSG